VFSRSLRQLGVPRVLFKETIPDGPVSTWNTSWVTLRPRLSHCDFQTAADQAQLNAVLRCCRRLGYLYDTDTVCVDQLFQSADNKLRKLDTTQLSPWFDLPPSSYDVRPCTHQKLLLDKTSYINNDEFVIHMLYRDSYWLLYMSMNYVLIFYILCYLFFLLVKVAFASFFFEEQKCMNESEGQLCKKMQQKQKQKQKPMSKSAHNKIRASTNGMIKIWRVLCYQPPSCHTTSSSDWNHWRAACSLDSSERRWWSTVWCVSSPE